MAVDLVAAVEQVVSVVIVVLVAIVVASNGATIGGIWMLDMFWGQTLANE